MQIISLNNFDKKKLKVDIKINLFMTTLFYLLVLLFLAVVFGIVYLFFEFELGYINRTFIILLSFFLPFIFLYFITFLKYIDLKYNKKLKFNSSNYVLNKKGDSNFIVFKNPKKIKFLIDDELLSFINKNEALNIEYTLVSKTLLFISNNNDNYLDKIAKD